MIKLLQTQNPDDATKIPVVLDASDVGVTGVTLSRASVEGNPRALNADVSFDKSLRLPEEGREHQLRVELYVLTEGHVAIMTDSQPLKSIGDLEASWDLATTSGGHGDIHAVLVKTFLDMPDTF